MGAALGLTGLALVLFNFFAAIAISTALTAITAIATKAFQKKPRREVLGFEDRTVTDIDSAAPWDIVFGEVRKGGTIVYKRITTDKQDMWVVVALAGHRCRAIRTLFIGDEASPITGASVGGTYAGFVEIFRHLGDDDQTADADLKAAFPDDWTDNHRLRGHCYAILHFTYSATLFNRGIPNPSFLVVGWDKVTDPRTGVIGYSDNPIACMYSYLRDPIFGVAEVADAFRPDELIAEANLCDEFVALPQRRDNFTSVVSTTFTVNTFRDSLTLADDLGLAEANPVTVSSTGTLPAPLAAATTYYWMTDDLDLQTKLATSEANALAKIPINITSTGSGTHTLTTQNGRLNLLGRSATTGVGPTLDRLNIDEALRIKTATRFRLSVTVTMPPPLIAGTVYYAVIVDADSINVAATLANAEAGTPIIDITGAETGTLTITLVGFSCSFTVDAATDIVTLAADQELATGDALHVASAGTLPGGLDADVGYRWIALTATTGRLALSRAQARRGEHINVTDAGSGIHSLLVDDLAASTLAGLVTGERCRVETTTTLPTPLVVDTDYYAIVQNRGTVKLAATLADALAGNDVGVSNAGTGTHTIVRLAQRRYTLNGMFDAETTPEDVLRAMLTSCAGIAVPPGDTWRLLAGAYRPPLKVLDTGDLRAPPRLSSRLPRDEAVNTVAGIYTASLNYDVPDNYPTADDPAYVAEDGQTLPSELLLPFTNSPDMALRLARIELERRRRQRTIEWPGPLALYPYEVGDGLEIDLPALGLEGLSCEIVTRKFANDPAGGGGESPPLPTIDLILRESDPWVYL